MCAEPESQRLYFQKISENSADAENEGQPIDKKKVQMTTAFKPPS